MAVTWNMSNSPKPASNRLLWVQLAFALLYGLALPLIVCLHFGWDWVFAIPAAAVWLLINLPVIEFWTPWLAGKAVKLLAKIQEILRDPIPFGRP